MKRERLNQIKELVNRQGKHADRILDGDGDNYDGADGAQNVLDLCDLCNELIESVEFMLEYDAKTSL